MPENTSEEKIKLFLCNINEVFNQESAQPGGNLNDSQNCSLDSGNSNSIHSKNVSLTSSTDIISTSMVSEDQCYLDQENKSYQPLTNLSLISPLDNNKKIEEVWDSSKQSDESVISEVIQTITPIVFKMNTATEYINASDLERKCKMVSKEKSSARYQRKQKNCTGKDADIKTSYDNCYTNSDISDMSIHNHSEDDTSRDNDYIPSENYSTTSSENIESNNLQENIRIEESQSYPQVQVTIVFQYVWLFYLLVKTS